eukprot:2062944-Alexandrium_andersonii.AAC.1
MTKGAFLSVLRPRRCRSTLLICPTSFACRSALTPHTLIAAAVIHSAVAVSPGPRGWVAAARM